MSLLRKNAVLREYRRQHHDSNALQSSSKDERLAEESGHDDFDEYPDLDAFEPVGPASRGVVESPPSNLRPNGKASQKAATRMLDVDSSRADLSSSPNAVPVCFERAQNSFTDSAAAAQSASPMFETPRGRGPVVDKVVDNASATSSRVRVSTSVAEALGGSNFLGSSSVIKPFDPSHSPPPSATGSPVALAAQSRAAATSTDSLGRRSQNDASSEEVRVIPGTHTNRPLSHPSLTPSRVTAGGETDVNMTGVTGKEQRACASPKRPTTRLASSTSLSHESREDRGSATISSAADKLHGPPGSREDARNIQSGSTALPRWSMSRRRSDLKPLEETVSSSTSSSTSPTSSRKVGKDSGVDSTQVVLREEDVRKLDMAHGKATYDSHTIAGASAKPSTLLVVRQDMSDTLWQPPTSILSEPSTLTTQTKSRPSIYFRAGESGAGSKYSETRRPLCTIDIDDRSCGGAFSPISEVDENDREKYAVAGSERNTSLGDSRAGAAVQQMLSHTATNRHLRVWHNEDIDMDPESSSTDSPPRSHPEPFLISFHEAYCNLMEEMRLSDMATAPTVKTEAVKSATLPVLSLHPASPAAALPKPKRYGFASLFLCCDGAVKSASIVPKQSSSRMQGAAERGRGEYSVSPAPQDIALECRPPEAHLRVVTTLKSELLSLQRPTHRRMLLTVFNTLTGNSLLRNTNDNLSAPAFDYPLMSPMRTSVRWELIGFQGSNPATDVRATGVLGVLQLLYLIDYYPSFAQRLWHLCTEPTSDAADASQYSQRDRALPVTVKPIHEVSNELPFVLVCFNFTAVVLDAADHHLLDDEIQRKSHLRLLATQLPKDNTTTNWREDDLFSHPGLYVCCEGFVGALALFERAWRARPQGRSANLPRVAEFGDIKARLRAQLLKKGAAKLMLDAACRVRETVEKHQ